MMKLLCGITSVFIHHAFEFKWDMRKFHTVDAGLLEKLFCKICLTYFSNFQWLKSLLMQTVSKNTKCEWLSPKMDKWPNFKSCSFTKFWAVGSQELWSHSSTKPMYKIELGNFVKSKEFQGIFCWCLQFQISNFLHVIYCKKREKERTIRKCYWCNWDPPCRWSCLKEVATSVNRVGNHSAPLFSRAWNLTTLHCKLSYRHLKSKENINICNLIL